MPKAVLTMLRGKKKKDKKTEQKERLFCNYVEKPKNLNKKKGFSANMWKSQLKTKSEQRERLFQTFWKSQIYCPHLPDHHKDNINQALDLSMLVFENVQQSKFVTKSGL